MSASNEGGHHSECCCVCSTNAIGNQHTHTHTQRACTFNPNYTQYFLLRVDAFGKQFVVSCVNVFRVFVDDALVIVSPPCEVLCAAMRLSVSVSALTPAHVNAHDNVCDTVGEAS